MLKWIGLVLLFAGTIFMNGEGKRNIISMTAAGIGGIMSGGGWLAKAFAGGSLSSKASLIVGIALLVIGVICLVLVLMDLPYLSHPRSITLDHLSGGRNGSDEGIGYFIEGLRANGTQKSFRISHKTFNGLDQTKKKKAEIFYLPHTDTVIRIRYE